MVDILSNYEHMEKSVESSIEPSWNLYIRYEVKLKPIGSVHVPDIGQNFGLVDPGEQDTRCLDQKC